MLLNPITIFHKVESCCSPEVKHSTHHLKVVSSIPSQRSWQQQCGKGEKMFETIGVWQGSLTEVESSVQLTSLY
jgi:hypothetical protein